MQRPWGKNRLWETGWGPAPEGDIVAGLSGQALGDDGADPEGGSGQDHGGQPRVCSLTAVGDKKPSRPGHALTGKLGTYRWARCGCEDRRGLGGATGTVTPSLPWPRPPGAGWSDSLQARQDAAGLSVPWRPQKPATQGWAKLLPTRSASPQKPPPPASPKGNEKSTTELWVQGNPQASTVPGCEYGKPAPPETGI